MKNIKILGTGCPKCEKMAANTVEAAAKAGLEIELEKVIKINDIMAFGVMMTPALVIDGEVRVTGKVPSVDEIVELLG